MKKIILWILIVISVPYFFANFLLLLLRLIDSSTLSQTSSFFRIVGDQIGIFSIIPLIYFIVIKNRNAFLITLPFFLITSYYVIFLYLIPGFYIGFSQIVWNLVFVISTLSAFIYSVRSLSQSS